MSGSKDQNTAASGNGHGRLTIHTTHDGRLYVDPDELIKNPATMRRLAAFAKVELKEGEEKTADSNVTS